MSQGEPNYNLLALSAMLDPSGARLVGALAQAQLMKQRQIEMQKQEALKSQFGPIGTASAFEDPVAGLEALGKLPTTGFHPESFEAMEKARVGLTRRAAAQAAGRARVQESPAETAIVPPSAELMGFPGTPDQEIEIPYHPDRAERGPYAEIEQRVAPMPRPIAPSQGAGFREGIAARATLPGLREIPEPAYQPTEITLAPPVMRLPRDEEELRGALSDRERAWLNEANLFKNLPPDLQAVKISAAGGIPEPPSGTRKSLDEMEAELQAFLQNLPPEDQAEVGPKATLALRQIQIAKTNKSGLSNAYHAYDKVTEALTKGRTRRESMDWKRTVLENHKRQFADQLDIARGRLAEAARTNDIAGADRALDNLRQLQTSLLAMINEARAQEGTQALVELLQQEYNQNAVHVNELTKSFKQQFGGGLRQGAPSGTRVTPPTSGTPAIGGTPKTSTTKTLKDGTVVTIEED